MERWITIENHPDYEVSSLGRVRNSRTGRILSTHLNNGSRRLKLDGKPCYVSRLLADTFDDEGEPIPVETHDEGPIVRCKDCIHRGEYDICDGENDFFYCGHGER